MPIDLVSVEQSSVRDRNDGFVRMAEAVSVVLSVYERLLALEF
jgi:hypothetical protein